MEIHNHGNALKPHAPIRSSVSGNQNVDQTNSSAEVEPSNQIQSGRLLERLQGDQEVRNRLLVNIQAKVQAGEYSTRDAAERAAEQITGL